MMWKLWNCLFKRNGLAMPTAKTDTLRREAREVASQSWRNLGNAKKLQFDQVSLAREADRARLVRHIADHPDQAVVHLTHYDGYVREAALRHVPLADASPALALLLLERCNDWVPVLRRLAMERLRDVVALLPETDLVPLVAAILGRATRWQRLSTDIGDLTSMFDAPAMRNAVNEYLLSASQGPVVRQARWAMRLGIVDGALAQFALRARSSALRAVATECLLDGKVYWTEGREKVWVDKPMGLYRTQPRWQSRALGPVTFDRVALLQSAARDKGLAVRRVVADHLCKTGPEPALAATIASLLEDQSRAVAHRMHFFRQKWPLKTD